MGGDVLLAPGEACPECGAPHVHETARARSALAQTLATLDAAPALTYEAPALTENVRRARRARFSEEERAIYRALTGTDPGARKRRPAWARAGQTGRGPRGLPRGRPGAPIP